MRRPAPARRVALGLGGALLAGGLAMGIPALAAHAEERAAWAHERAQMGTAAYDARLSDRHYAASRDAWRRSGFAGHLLGAGLLLFTLGAVAPRSAGAAPAPRPRVAGASLIDAGLGAAVLALAFVDAGESAALRALAGAAPWLSALPVAPLVAGTSAGLRILGLRVAPGPRALVAVVLWPLGLLALVGWAAPSLSALHLRLAGLVPRRASAVPPVA